MDGFYAIGERRPGTGGVTGRDGCLAGAGGGARLCFIEAGAGVPGEVVDAAPPRA